MHPKALEHKLLREAAAKEQLEKDKEITKRIEQYGLKFIHIRKKEYWEHPITGECDNQYPQKGGITVAYWRCLPKGQFLDIAVAYTHPKDSFCKKEGRYHSSRAFEDGWRIPVRVPKGEKISAVLRNMFEPLL